MQLTLTVDTTFLRTTSAISQSVFRILLHAELDAFLVGDIDGRPRWIGQRQPSQLDGTLVGTTQGERAVRGSSAQAVGDFIAIDIIGIRRDDADMRPIDGRFNILRHIPSDGDRSRLAVVFDTHRVVLNLRTIDGHRINISQYERTSHNRNRLAISVCHLARL